MPAYPLDTRAIQTYDLALKTLTDPVILARLEELKTRHTRHAEQLSQDMLKMLHNQIATHWDAITSAAIENRQPESVPQMRVVSGG